jgi:predicted AAA+ superfamily ATPase
MQLLSFKEYISACNIFHIRNLTTTSVDIFFQDYLHNSSFPYVIQILAWQGHNLPPNKRLESEQVRQFLSDLFNSIVLKDIVERKGVKDVPRLNRVIKFLFDNIGSETSIRNIKNKLEHDNGLKIDVNTIESYIDGLIDAFVIYKVSRYDIKGKQHLKTNAKYYVADIGLRYLLLGRDGDSGHILENIVYLELIRRGYSVSIGKIGNLEIDFVAVKDGNTEYYQVAQEVSDKITRERELRAMDVIDDHNPKFLITMGSFFTEGYKGIRIVNALDWLISE